MDIRLPRNTEAEQIYLSGVLEDPDLLSENRLSPNAFDDESNRRIYEAVLELEAEGEDITLFPLLLKLKKTTKQQAKIIADRGALPTEAKIAAKVIKENATRRALIMSCNKIMMKASANENETDLQELCSKAEQSILDATENQMGEIDYNNMAELIQDYDQYQKMKSDEEGLIGVSTGLKKLDDWTCGLQPATLIYMGGRPGMGKSDLAINIALNAAQAGHKTLFFSLEMWKNRIMERMVSHLGSIAATRLQRGLNLDNTEINNRYFEAIRKATSLPLIINDTPGLSVNEIASICRRAQRKQGLDLVIIDYFQKISYPEGYRKTDDQLIKIVSDTLFNLSKKLEIPILCLSQLSRSVENRPDKRPLMSDLRESGNLEQDAEQIWFLYRHSYYHPKQAKKTGDENTVELLIRKNREGPVGKILLEHIPNYHLFKEAYYAKYVH